MAVLKQLNLIAIYLFLAVPALFVAFDIANLILIGMRSFQSAIVASIMRYGFYIMWLVLCVFVFLSLFKAFKRGVTRRKIMYTFLLFAASFMLSGSLMGLK